MQALAHKAELSPWWLVMLSKNLIPQSLADEQFGPPPNRASVDDDVDVGEGGANVLALVTALNPCLII